MCLQDTSSRLILFTGSCCKPCEVTSLPAWRLWEPPGRTRILLLEVYTHTFLIPQLSGCGERCVSSYESSRRNLRWKKWERTMDLSSSVALKTTRKTNKSPCSVHTSISSSRRNHTTFTILGACMENSLFPDCESSSSCKIPKIDTYQSFLLPQGQGLVGGKCRV